MNDFSDRDRKSLLEEEEIKDPQENLEFEAPQF